MNEPTGGSMSLPACFASLYTALWAAPGPNLVLDRMPDKSDGLPDKMHQNAIKKVRMFVK